MNRVRDNQRTKLYRAEWEVKQLFPIVSREELYEFIDFVMESELSNMRYTVAHTRKRGAWCRYKNGYLREGDVVEEVELNFASDCMTLFIAIHEICHAICPSPEGYEPHGPQFAQKQLELTRDYLGEKYAETLEEGYKKYGVKYGDEIFSSTSRKAANSSWITEKRYYYSIPITPTQRYLVEDALLYYFNDAYKEMIALKKTRLEVVKSIWYEDFVYIIGKLEEAAICCSYSDRQRDGMQEWCWKVRGELCKKYVSKEGDCSQP